MFPFFQNLNCNDIDSIIHDEHVDIIFIYDICNDRSSLINFDIKYCLHLETNCSMPLIRFESSLVIFYMILAAI